MNYDFSTRSLVELPIIKGEEERIITIKVDAIELLSTYTNNPEKWTYVELSKASNWLGKFIIVPLPYDEVKKKLGILV